MCGENSHTPVTTVFAPGSSPRVRGKLETFRPDQFTLRLIPACAGKTLALFVMRSHVRAHPRVCGENWAAGPLGLFVEGSSPRVRGKRFACLFLPSCSGLIPACAGKTPTKHATKSSNKAHPRVCGENPSNASPRSFECGSSPRVRGKRVFEYVAGGGQWAHPRVCGENKPGMIHAGVTKGSSPRVRGKPRRPRRRQTPPTAHPRVCGENPGGVLFALPALGSSPRVRGKRSSGRAVRHTWGLIPACAGKTTPLIPPAIYTRAHPRVCGENASQRRGSLAAPGSSPRVRGKRQSEAGITCGPRLIPACAGKTATRRRFRRAVRAHPRVCGENPLTLDPNVFDDGSSPRVRGKPYGCRPTYPSPGLIPACAGKTCRPRAEWLTAWAHPRVCGENSLLTLFAAGTMGSSPRVRGKQGKPNSNEAYERLIPACAGKTPVDEGDLRRSAAHPRVCGENTRIKGQRLGLSGSSPRVRGKHSRD